MSGHSKWSTIKRKKGALDAKRGKIFTKVTREITVAAKRGGPHPESNARLRLAIDKAKAANMPNENISRAIKKGSGADAAETNYEEYMLEGYGPGGAAVLAEVMTDNKNRTTPEIRKAFQKHGGAMGAEGCVAWQFQKKGFLVIDQKSVDENKLMEVALDAGAEDIRNADKEFEVITPYEQFQQVKHRLEEQKIPCVTAEISMLPQNLVKLSGQEAQNMLKLMEELEDLDDVQNVYSNFDLDENTVV